MTLLMTCLAAKGLGMVIGAVVMVPVVAYRIDREIGWRELGKTLAWMARGR